MRAAPEGVWRNAEFLKLWIGGTVSAIGSQVTVLAMPPIAVLIFSAGPAQTGLLTAASYAPMLVFGLPAGAWVDRLRRRPVRIAADLGSALVIGCQQVQRAGTPDLVVRRVVAETEVGLV